MISENRPVGLFYWRNDMKREEKNALSKQRILDAAMEEFSRKGYEGASLNTVCAEKGISKGIIYHHFRDKDELYLLCVKNCFDAITASLQDTMGSLTGSPGARLKAYFDARLRFFAEHPLYLGIFSSASFDPPAALSAEIAECRKDFDRLNVSVLTELLESAPMRKGLSVEAVVEDFRLYMDYFNLHFRMDSPEVLSPEDRLKKHEERCHRQLDILLYGVMGEINET